MFPISTINIFPFQILIDPVNLNQFLPHPSNGCNNNDININDNKKNHTSLDYFHHGFDSDAENDDIIDHMHQVDCEHITLNNFLHNNPQNPPVITDA